MVAFSAGVTYSAVGSGLLEKGTSRAGAVMVVAMPEEYSGIKPNSMTFNLSYNYRANLSSNISLCHVVRGGSGLIRVAAICHRSQMAENKEKGGC